MELENFRIVLKLAEKLARRKRGPDALENDTDPTED